MIDIEFAVTNIRMLYVVEGGLTEIEKKLDNDLDHYKSSLSDDFVDFVSFDCVDLSYYNQENSKYLERALDLLAECIIQLEKMPMIKSVNHFDE